MKRRLAFAILALLSPPPDRLFGAPPRTADPEARGADAAPPSVSRIAAAEAAPALGFGAAAWAEQRDLERRFSALLDPKRISSTHRLLTARPHRTGTEGARRVAEYVRDEARKAGFAPQVATYLFYNSHPGPRTIALTAPVVRSIGLVEDRIPGDPWTERAAEHQAFCAYSGSGTVEGEVVYAGQGTWEDFEELDRRGISLQGRVALMRYFGAGEGTKVLRAEERGAAGAVLYADPLEDGFVHGPVYPRGNWRPPGSIMRRSLADTPYEGDPLTPGWASKPGARRLDPAAVQGLPRIPVLPISYRDAALVLSHLGGPEAPERMQGGLLAGGAPAGAERLTYRLGPGPARLRLSVVMRHRSDTIRNVIVRIPGAHEPDAWVVLGNHHDAWIYGAGDPSSGTAADLEALRALGRLMKDGWRPRRTVIVAFWDAEEMNLGGSTEWAEEHAEELRRKGVAVINMDSAVFNPERPLYVAASPCLHRLFRETAAAVPSPRGQETLFDLWLRQQNEARGLTTVETLSGDYDPSRPLREPYIDPVPLGDDQTPFVEFLALPGSDMYYGADYGTYHSLYENRRWMESVVDPKFLHHRTMADFHGRLGLRLAMAPILPLDAEGSAAAWGRALRDAEGRASAQEMPGSLLRPVRRALRRYDEAAGRLAAARDAALVGPGWPARAAADGGADSVRARLAEVNRELAAVERSFFSPRGLPGFAWYRGLWAAPPRPVPRLAESRLPGLRWAIEQGSEAGLQEQAAVYAEALDEATAHLNRARGLIEALSGAR
jgi:N-acetylated-alpha-linked acidic dipeptidase